METLSVVDTYSAITDRICSKFTVVDVIVTMYSPLYFLYIIYGANYAISKRNLKL